MITEAHRWISLGIVLLGFVIWGTKQYLQVNQNKKDIEKVSGEFPKQIEKFEDTVGRWKDETQKCMIDIKTALSNLEGQFEMLTNWIKNGRKSKRG